ncbi:unnamed protein product [Closterium sp. Yama58-4]|nr:unnamed protein product [Closterium sp. Yama58-4]
MDSLPMSGASACCSMSCSQATCHSTGSPSATSSSPSARPTPTWPHRPGPRSPWPASTCCAPCSTAIPCAAPLLASSSPTPGSPALSSLFLPRRCPAASPRSPRRLPIPASPHIHLAPLAPRSPRFRCSRPSRAIQCP